MLLLRKQMKLELKDKTKANGKKCYAGPIFGDGDVYIADCCHNNKKSHFGFPKSYQFDDKELKDKKVSSKLTGYFSILEYEVYTIISKWYVYKAFIHNLDLVFLSILIWLILIWLILIYAIEICIVTLSNIIFTYCRHKIQLMEVENKEFDQLLEAIYMGKTTMKCSSDNKITQLCIDKKCRLNAGFCADDECDECSTHESGLCGSQKIKAVTKILQGICKSQKSFVEKLIIL